MTHRAAEPLSSQQVAILRWLDAHQPKRRPPRREMRAASAQARLANLARQPLIERLASDAGVDEDFVWHAVASGKLRYERLEQPFASEGQLILEEASSLIPPYVGAVVQLRELALAEYVRWAPRRYLGRTPTKQEGPSITRAMRELVTRGFVDERRPPGEKRKSLKRLTRKGIEVLIRRNAAR